MVNHSVNRVSTVPLPEARNCQSPVTLPQNLVWTAPLVDCSSSQRSCLYKRLCVCHGTQSFCVHRYGLSSHHHLDSRRTCYRYAKHSAISYLPACCFNTISNSASQATRTVLLFVKYPYRIALSSYVGGKRIGWHWNFRSRRLGRLKHRPTPAYSRAQCSCLATVPLIYLFRSRSVGISSALDWPARSRTIGISNAIMLRFYPSPLTHTRIYWF